MFTGWLEKNTHLFVDFHYSWFRRARAWSPLVLRCFCMAGAAFGAVELLSRGWCSLDDYSKSNSREAPRNSSHNLISHNSSPTLLPQLISTQLISHLSSQTNSSHTPHVTQSHLTHLISQSHPQLISHNSSHTTHLRNSTHPAHLRNSTHTPHLSHFSLYNRHHTSLHTFRLKILHS